MDQKEIEVKEIEVKEVLPATIGSAAPKPGHLFYQAGWLSLLMQQYGFRLWKSCGPGGEYMLFAQAKGLMGNKLVSLPFSDYTIPQVSPERLPLHIAALQHRFPEMPLVLKCTDWYASPQLMRCLGAPVAKACLHKVIVDGLTTRRMSGSFRRSIRKAYKNGLTAAYSTSETSLQQFYTLYYRLRIEKLGLIPQPYSFFERVYEEFIQKGQGFFYEVKHEGAVIASAIVLREGQELFYKWGCSSQHHLHLRPNNLLFRGLLKLAAKMGCHTLDLGLSDLDETRGLIRFKNNMGGKASFIYTYCYCPPNFSLTLEKQLKSRLNQLAGMIVEYKLPPAQTQSFSQSLYPLFV